MTTYRIDGEDGTEVACGIQTAEAAERRARELAQATRRVYCWGEDRDGAEMTDVDPVQQCGCSCGCSEPATQRCEGEHVCDECADYYVTDDGEVVCSREQDESACRHCDEPIQWGSIQTGQPGESNWREGRCSCRQWTSTERGPGNAWGLSESGVRQ